MKNATHDDADMICRFRNWPCWPYLPVKRRNNNIEDGNLGVMMANQNHADAVAGKPGAKFVVYHVYLFALPNTKAGWEKLSKVEYDTLEALLKDGWVVD